MILLTDGSVLIHNADKTPGFLAPQTAAQWLRLTPDDHGQYNTPGVTWSAALPMTTAREYFASGVLRDGRVFVIGGEYSSDTVNTPAPPSSGQDSPLGEIFDPVTGQWSPILKPATFSYIKGDVPACVLADGRVLLGSITTNQTVLWDPPAIPGPRPLPVLGMRRPRRRPRKPGRCFRTAASSPSTSCPCRPTPPKGTYRSPTPGFPRVPRRGWSCPSSATSPSTRSARRSCCRTAQSSRSGPLARRGSTTRRPPVPGLRGLPSRVLGR